MSLNINLVSFNFYKKNFNQSSQHNLNNSILLIYIYTSLSQIPQNPSYFLLQQSLKILQHSKYFYQNGQFTKNLQTEKSPYLQSIVSFHKLLFPFQLSPKFVQFLITSILSREKIIVLFHRPQNRGISIGNPKPDR